jgi:hypothetical protein
MTAPYMRFEIFRLAKTQKITLGIITRRNVVDGYQHFGATCCHPSGMSALKVEASGSSKMLVPTDETTQKSKVKMSLL